MVLAGQILGLAAVHDGKKVVQTQSYGAEARGSAAKSEVIISDDPIGFPAVRRCDVLVAMSQKALELHAQGLTKTATLLVEADLTQHLPSTAARIYELPANKLADTQLKSRIYANLIMLGALTRITKIVSRAAVEKAIAAVVSAETANANLQAFAIGFNLQHQEGHRRGTGS